MSRARVWVMFVVVVACEGKSTTRGDAEPAAPSQPAAPADAAPSPQAAPTEAPAPAGGVQTLIRLPDEMPADLDTACSEVGVAYDGYMKRAHPEGSEARAEWDKKRGGQLKMTNMLCAKNGSLDAAACQAYAFDHAGPELEDSLGELMRRCMEKFGGPAPPQ